MCKKCSICKKRKPVYLFTKNSSKKDGLGCYCKKCQNEYNKQRYPKNREKFLQRTNIYYKSHKKERQEYYKKHTQYYQKNKKIRYLKNRKILINLKINGCAICGYNKCVNALNFHHTNPKDKEFYINAYTITKKNIVEELNKCILLCSNCHDEIHFRGKELWEN